jgi:hypothetical protein
MGQMDSMAKMEVRDCSVHRVVRVFRVIQGISEQMACKEHRVFKRNEVRKVR